MDSRKEINSITPQQPYDDEPLKYPEAFRPSQAFKDSIEAKGVQPCFYDEKRDLYYYVCDDDDLVPEEEVRAGALVQSHQELEFHIDSNGRKYYEADDLESEDDNEDECIIDNDIKSQQTHDVSPMKYPDKFQLSQATIDAINAKPHKPCLYDESRDLYYVVDDDLIPVEEARAGGSSPSETNQHPASPSTRGLFSVSNGESSADECEKNRKPTP